MEFYEPSFHTAHAFMTARYPIETVKKDLLIPASDGWMGVVVSVGSWTALAVYW